MAIRTTSRTRLTVSATVLLIGAAASACGGGAGGGAPTDASEKEFCQTQSSLLEDLLPEDMANPELPSDEQMAEAVKDWGSKLEEVGTPEDIPDDARKGFEAVVEQANEIDASDFSIEKLEELEAGGKDASAEAKKQAAAFEKYLTDTCGNPLDNLDLPEMPDSN
ncbi:hypothetical protein [Nocardioides baculatus]|jgi:hypothetical protein|uniref:Small secreted protein n=1 Tax=Nocardioides baculatus TaxID=2801337 RepID=A0ABS1L4C2_9ACTN|nr:hypothetical protein [Nocardioides baculatus]MBL0746534.1 hypothetical protein [Nocardioides baculatus]